MKEPLVRALFQSADKNTLAFSGDITTTDGTRFTFKKVPDADPRYTAALYIDGATEPAFSAEANTLRRLFVLFAREDRKYFKTKRSAQDPI